MLATKQINYNNKGFNILIISGVHGNETHAVKANWELYQKLSQRSLDYIHEIKWVFNLNEYGLVHEIRGNDYKQEESKDINRMFPKTFMDAAEIRAFVAQQDYDIVIDIHNSPYCIPCILIDHDLNTRKILSSIKGSELIPVIRHTNIGTIKKYFNTKGYGYTIELPSMGIHGNYTKSVDMLIQFVQTIANNIQNKNEFECKYELPIDLYTTIEQGIIEYTREIVTGEYIKDEIIAHVVDLKDGYTEPIHAPYDGYVFDISDSCYVSNMNAIIMYGKGVTWL